MKIAFSAGLILGALIFGGLTAFSEHPETEEVVIEDGTRIIRIEAGEERGNLRDVLRRLRRMEQAVSDLQEYCYDLPLDYDDEDDLWTCKVKGMDQFFYGQGETKGDAEKIAMEKCQGRYSAMMCGGLQCSKD